ncbi:hypothetical protein [Amycolatopsis taiwanensis]|uniref:hypothetical protein n=1 Tax=Amycolatopsis taiwanensis TaxID=342230 RepID=UPI000487FBC6|nr:hypothetical protein [Amycolatopsis taiwanensis]
MNVPIGAVTLALGTVSLFLAARLTARFGVRKVLLTGMFALGTGLALLSRAPPLRPARSLEPNGAESTAEPVA